MHLRRLRGENFRNLVALDVELSPRTNVFAGPNGQGKTNLVEAVYFAATLKPLRANRLQELVRWGEARARVAAEFELSGGPRELAVEVESGHRRATVDGKLVENVVDYFGGQSVVAFTPDDLLLVKGGPERRRRWLDRATWSRWPAYLDEAREFLKALRSRNRLLQENAPDDMVRAFDAPLARAGDRVRERRRALLDELAPRAVEVFARVGAPREGAELALAYRCSGPGPEIRPLAESLEEGLRADRERRHTRIGPHADDVALTLAGHAARAYASQGQARALVIALKIAEMENLRAALGRYPILLLDDVSSELDAERNTYLMAYLSALESQVLLTTTDADLVRGGAGKEALFFAVSEGGVSGAPGAIETQAITSG